MFDPKVDGFSDLRLVKAMDRLSVNGQLAYTEKQLFYAVSGRKVVGPTLGQRLRRGPRWPKHIVPTLESSRFSGLLDTWLSLGGATRGRLIRATDLASAPNRHPAGGAVPAEIAAHGFDRAIVVDSAEVAIMLVANNFHVDRRCAVISADGYPEAFLGSLLELLNRNPNLVVAVAHGARLDSMDLVGRIRAWFPATTVRLVEVGLRPRQVISSKLFATTPASADGPDDATLNHNSLARLSDDERRWLAWGLSTDLESLAPAQLMRVLTQAFNQLAQHDEQQLGRPNRTSSAHPQDGSRHFDEVTPGWPGVIFLDSGGDRDGAENVSTFDDSDGFGFDGADFDGDG